MESVVAAGNETAAAADDVDHRNMQIRLRPFQMVKRNLQQRRLFRTAERQQHQLFAGKRTNSGNARKLKHPFDGAGNFIFGGNRQIHRNVVVAEQAAPGRLMIHPGADARHFAGNIEQRICRLAGNHVDFVAFGCSDQQVAFAGFGLLQHVRMGDQTQNRHHVPFAGDFV